MNCQHWKPILFDLARGLQTDSSQEAYAHAQECVQCSAELEEQHQLNQKLKLLTADQGQHTEEKVPIQLLNALRNSQSIAKRNRQLLFWARAAVLIVVIFGGWMWYRSIDLRIAPPVSDFQSVEYDGEFIPLQFGNHPVNSWQIVRVELESSALQELGFPRVPEWEERPVQADIVVGDDGLPQAIRFVSLDR